MITFSSRKIPLVPAVLFSAWLLFHVLTLTRFPFVNWDENMEANHSWNFWNEGRNFYSLYDDVYPEGFDFLKHSAPNVIRPFYQAPLALTLGVFGPNVFAARL